MKYKKSIALAACLVSMALITGCPDNKKSQNTTAGAAPDSLAGRSLSVSVGSGSPPFVSAGAYVFTPAGDGTSGTYQLQGSGGVQSNNGTYTYTKTGGSTGSLVETESVSGTVVNNTLSFQSASSGTIASSSPNKGGSQNGSFTLN
jgi:hypothetical protein